MNDTTTNTISADELTQKHRTRVIQDIGHWKCELERHSDFGRDQLDQFIEVLEEKDDDELIHCWETTVGEWIASRDTLPRPEFVEFDTYLQVQFGKLVAGYETDYGFVVTFALPEVAD